MNLSSICKNRTGIEIKNTVGKLNYGQRSYVKHCGKIGMKPQRILLTVQPKRKEHST